MMRWSVSSPRPPRSRLRSWLFIAVSALILLAGATTLWTQLRFSFRGVHATGRVIDFHQTAARSMSTIAEVEVAGLAPAPMRIIVQDTFGVVPWEKGIDVKLVCLALDGGEHRCVVDSWRDRWALPLAFLAAGAGLLAWCVRKR